MANREAPLTLRLGDLKEDVLSRGPSPGITIKKDLRRYYQLLSTSVPVLSKEEVTALLRVPTESRFEPSYMSGALFDAGEDELARKIRALPYLERLALADAVERAHWLIASGVSDDEALRIVKLC